MTTKESKLEPEKLELASLAPAVGRRAGLLDLFPEARTEGNKIDFEQLKRALGEAVDQGKERYGLTWPGKADCYKTIQTPSIATLLPVPEDSVNFDATENLIIEGDNLEVLKLLQKSYLGKVKMIYIDPPYNTGNDFIYPDNYSESLQTYLEYTGQIDAQGRKFGTNTEADGRFHSKWLNMMFPRLYLAKNLLKADGVIFISIDDTEEANLRLLCDDIFGPENFLAQLVWEGAFKNDARQVGVSHEYVVLYAKDRSSLPQSWTLAKEGVSPVLAEVDRLRAKFGDDFENASAELAGWFRANKAKPIFAHRRFRNVDKRGAYKEDDPTAPGGRKFDLKNPSSGEIIPLRANRGWAFDQSTFDKMVAEGRITFVTPKSIMVRRYLHETDSMTPQSVFYQPARSASERLSKLMGEAVFEFPKDEVILKQFIEMATSANGDDIVLDFFAGSGSTAHAVFDVNEQQGTTKKFILVQLPEVIDHSKYKTMADVTKERVRRVIQNMKMRKKDTLDLSRTNSENLGFRVFKLAESNFKVWDAEAGSDGGSIEDQLELHIDHLRESRSATDILYEILLKSGFPLTASVEKLTLCGKSVFGVAGGALLICLERELTLELIRAMADRKPERAVCLDEGFAGNDQLKTNAVQTFKTKNVVFRTV